MRDSLLVFLLSLMTAVAAAAELKAKLSQIELVHHKQGNHHLAAALLSSGIRSGSDPVERHTESAPSWSYQTHLPSQLQLQVLIKSTNATKTSRLSNIIKDPQQHERDEHPERALVIDLSHESHASTSSKTPSKTSRNVKDDTPLHPDFFVDVVAPMNFRNALAKNPGLMDQLVDRGSVLEKKTTKTPDFSTDVVAPLDLTAMHDGLPTLYSNDDAFSTTTIDEDSLRRRLQNQQLQCFRQNDGSLACVLDDFPRQGLILIFFGCPNRAGATVFDCEGCRIVEESSPQFIDATDPQCSDCQICAQGVSLDCSNFDPDQRCAVQDCAGNCVNGASPPPSPPSGSGDVTTGCFSQENGSVACTVESFPRDGLILAFLNCPTVAGSTLLDCNSCVVVEEQETALIDGDDPQCSSCSMCGDTVGFNCANLDPGVACAVQDCAGTCTGDGASKGGTPDPAPSPARPPQPTPASPPPPRSELTCFENGNTLACALNGYPNDGLLIVFFDCPSEAGSTVFDCASCAIIDEDDLTLVSNDSLRCSSCTLCRDTQTIGFDCSNVDPQGGSCVVQDCVNGCVNPFGGATSGASQVTTLGVYPVSALMTVAALVLWV